MAEFIKKEGNKVSFKLTLPVEEITTAENEVFKKNRNLFQVPGFRKGHVPKKIIENMYGKDVFFEDAVNEILPGAYEKAIEELGLKVIDSPNLDFEEHVDGQDLIANVDVLVQPEIEIDNYKGIEVKTHTHEVTEELIDNIIEQQRKLNARIVNIDNRPVENGDRVNIDYSGSTDGEKFPGGTAENQDLEIGSNTFIPGFEEQLIGHNVGEEFEINVTFPEEYHDNSLAGKEAIFEIILNGISVEELPELDDEFIKDISDFDTVQEYRDDVLAKKTEEYKELEKQERESQAVAALADLVEDEIPEVMVDNLIDNEVERYEQNFRAQGFGFEQYLSMLGSSLEQYREEMRPEALKNVKSRLALEAIVAKEDFQVTDEEVLEDAREAAAKYYPEDEEKREQMVKMISESNTDALKEDLKIRKAIELVVENANFVIEEHDHHHDHDHDEETEEVVEEKEETEE